MTLRHALANLARRGLVTRTVGRRGGTFVAESKLEQDLTTLAGFSEQLRRHGMVAGARVLSATERPAGPVAVAALEVAEGAPLYEVRRVRLGDTRDSSLEIGSVLSRDMPKHSLMVDAMIDRQQTKMAAETTSR